MIQYIKFGQIPSFGSRDRMQTRCFWPKFYIQSADVTLKMRSRSPKSNHFFPMSQGCLHASLVKIHLLVQEIAQTMHIFSFYSVVTLKNRSRSPKSFPIFELSQCYNTYKVWP